MMQPILELIYSSVRGGQTPHAAARLLKASGVDNASVDAALTRYTSEARQRRGPDQPGSLDDTDLEDWYPGPGPEDRFWPALRNRLLDSDWTSDIVGSIDHQSTRVTARLSSPGRAEFNTRGLVIGYVQSGKTANFSAVIAKAADTGYRLIIVLSGLTNLLRSQTQLRLEGDLVDPTRPHWVLLTSDESDFHAGQIGNINAFLADHGQHKVLCVIKKNATVLRRLLQWLNAANENLLDNIPALVIDDEADQASINTGPSDEVRSTINRLILRIIHRLPRASYVGYTASPFANVFIDPAARDLYPKDFILSLPMPPGYFGPEAIFGREPLEAADPPPTGFDMIRHVHDDEIQFLQPPSAVDRFAFQPELTPSLRQAMNYFWLATAARRSRGHIDFHSTMLVHTTMYVAVHATMSSVIESYRRAVLNGLQNDDEGFLEELRNLWNAESERVPAIVLGEEQTTFTALRPHLTQVVSSCLTPVENAVSDTRLDYRQPACQIVIGGNVLSRGLTLEGLVVSFFLRAASAYDTLLQMGRWFGYRLGYSDLPRIWMTAELERYFFDLATVEQEIRNDIRRYEVEGLRPLDFGPRVRTHPALNITSRMKMQAAIPASVSYSGRRLQTILFNHKDAAWLNTNISATRDLIHAAIAAGVETRVRHNSRLFYRVPVRLINTFFDRYNFHDQSIELRRNLIQNYIRDQNQSEALLWWNIAIVGKAFTSNSPTFELAHGLQVPLLIRSRLRMSDITYASLGAIMSKIDRVLDLDVARADVRASDEGQLQAMRPIDVGLLLLYPIDRNSSPQSSIGGQRRRVPLNAAEHLIGVGVVFPTTENLTAQNYMTVDLSHVRREELEFEYDDEPNNDDSTAPIQTNL